MKKGIIKTLLRVSMSVFVFATAYIAVTKNLSALTMQQMMSTMSPTPVATASTSSPIAAPTKSPENAKCEIVTSNTYPTAAPTPVGNTAKCQNKSGQSCATNQSCQFKDNGKNTIECQCIENKK